MKEKEGALEGVRILDLTDERGIYGAKLLADLGADVVRPEPPGRDPLRARGPHLGEVRGDGRGDGRGDERDGNSSLWYAFFASNRRFFSVDPESREGAAQLRLLVARADIILTCRESFCDELIDLEKALKDNPSLVIVDVSSFGTGGPWQDYLAPDLVAGALGGACATTGDVDTPPLKAFGELNFMVSGSYVAIAAMSALFHVRQTGQGQRVDVPVHECIASCLEHVFMVYWYDHLLEVTSGPVLPRRGSLHWTDVYHVVKAIGGSIMVTPAPASEELLLWLVQEDAHGDLLEEQYQDPDNLLATARRIMELTRAWVSGREVEELFFEAQSRHSPFGWVLPIEKVADNPHLKARDWWATYNVDGTETPGPGAPYHFSETPWSNSRIGVSSGTSSQEILADIGWGEKS